MSFDVVRDVVQLLGPAVTGLGIVLSIWGTFLLTRWYHPFNARGLLRTALRVLRMLFKGDAASVFREAKTAARLGAINDEAKSESLVGLYFIFLGFILQGIGTAFWATDVIWGIAEKHMARH